MSHALTVLYDKTVVATIQKNSDDTIAFVYTEEWKQHGFAISPHLPLSGTFRSQDALNFILNLLPEGEGLDKLSHLYHISKSNHLALLRAIGKETSGALSFGFDETTLVETSFREVSREELTKRILERKEVPISVWDGKVRLSLAGIQEKLPITLIDGTYGFGEGDLASTHILKFGDHNHLVLNEFLSLDLARATGLSVNKAEIVYFGEEPVLQIERFDRQLSADLLSVKRYHVIDGCQFLSLPPSYKYEQIFGNERDVAHIREGVSFTKLFQNRDNVAIPALYTQALIQWTIINLCLGNCDAHGKNISFFVNSSGILTLTPFYDIVNISLYETFDQSLAMAIGDQFDIKHISAYNLAEYAHQHAINKKLFVRHFNEIYKKITKRFESQEFQSYATFDPNFFTLYYTNVKERMERLKDSFEAFLKTDYSTYF